MTPDSRTDAADPANDLMEDLVRDAYAHFGLAYFLAECVFQGLVNVFATSKKRSTRGDVEERMREASALTLGPLVASARALFPADAQEDLNKLVERRNLLAHGFWFQRAHMMTSANGLEALIAELKADQELFRRLSRLTDDISDVQVRAAGIRPDEGLDEAILRASRGPPERLPERPTLKLGARLSLAKAWTVAGSIIFQDDAGHLWQPSAVGLGWYLGTPAPDWKRADPPSLMPASVVGRPKGAADWDWVLEFSSGYALSASIDTTSGLPLLRLRRRRKR